MSGRPVEPVEIPPACPFVAFEDDRERRSTAPDHRHRCYAEPRPAPRALAHQERYCLTRDFPSCPTFQAWARREAARGFEPNAPREVPAGHAPVDPEAWVTPPVSPLSRYAPPAARAQVGQLAAFGDEEPAADAEPATDAGPAAGEMPADTQPDAPRAGAASDEDGGHAELAALVGGAAAAAAGGTAAAARGTAAAAGGTAAGGTAAGDSGSDAPAFLAGRSGTRPGPPAARASRGSGPRQPPPPGDGTNPPWERPRRNEFYPTLRTRSGMPNIPPVALALTALIVAAVLLFVLPSLLPGNGGTTPTGSVAASDTAAATSVAPTIAAGPTPLIYTVKSGDLLSTIASKFHVSLADLEAANPQITDPNKIKIGDKITIPVPGVTIPASPTP
ncbi:MAG TPA: LysM peptidoglycan-binding domain-containing protein [Candidatus Sulfotelmatobacter sp.]|nr:LysM peptidoglycan-binding domain-containing protein [Candidatus Sulfotelmatobacter sp.]